MLCILYWGGCMALVFIFDMQHDKDKKKAEGALKAMLTLVKWTYLSYSKLAMRLGDF